MISSRKLMLTSKTPADQCTKMPTRKPVKNCYCYSEMKRMHQRLSRLPQKCASSCRCANQSELILAGETDETIASVSPISCETLRRVQRIDYVPRSQFLRKVQSKICELQSRRQGDCPRMCPRSSIYHRFMASLSSERDSVDARQEESSTFPSAPANSLVSVRGESDRGNTVHASSAKTSTQKLANLTLRKTVRSKGQVSESRKTSSKSPIRKHNRKQERSKMIHDQGERTIREDEDQKSNTLDVPEHYEENHRCTKCDKSIDHEVQDLRRFREQHYFETHGSSHTLASPRSSGSLEQYFLNDRLFPEPVGRIRGCDSVVTMPPCATTQRKRVHYFPRYVIRQERDNCNTNYRRKRCQNTCPLIGHAIDLGVLKVKLPVDSLALKYQKTIDTIS